MEGLTALTGWQAAEEIAARWTRAMGYPDAQRTPAGADGGIDVLSERAIGQVKAWRGLVGRPDLQRLAGAGTGRPGNPDLLFFVTNGYTFDARVWAIQTGMALFALARVAVTPETACDSIAALTPDAEHLLAHCLNGSAARARTADVLLAGAPISTAWFVDPASAVPVPVPMSRADGLEAQVRAVEAFIAKAGAEPRSTSKNASAKERQLGRWMKDWVEDYCRGAISPETMRDLTERIPRLRSHLYYAPKGRIWQLDTVEYGQERAEAVFGWLKGTTPANPFAGMSMQEARDLAAITAEYVYNMPFRQGPIFKSIDARVEALFVDERVQAVQARARQVLAEPWPPAFVQAPAAA